MGWTAIVVAEDLVTCACGAANAGYFASYRPARGSRRAGALVLALVSVAAVVEAAFSQALYWSQRGAMLPAPSGAEWALVRLPLLIATLLITVIIARRVAG